MMRSPACLPVLRSAAFLAALAGGLALPRAAAAQCAMCGAAAASGKVGQGIAYSIFFLLGTLFAVVLWLVVLVLRARRRAAGGSQTDAALLPGAQTAFRLATGAGIDAAPPATGRAPAER